MLVLLIHIYWFFQKHKIILWSLLSAIALVFLFFIIKVDDYDGVQFMIYPLLLIILLAALLFGNIVNSLVAALPAVFGGGIVLIVIMIFKLHFTIYTFLFESVIITFSCIYSVYMIRLLKSEENIEGSLKETFISITQRSLVTSVAFFCLMFTKSDMLREIGFYSGVGILGAALFTLVFLPHLIKRNKVSEGRNKKSIIDKITQFSGYANWILIVLIILIALLFVFQINECPIKKEAYYDSSIYLLIILIPLGLTFFFGRIELGMISFLPMFTGWLWAIGMMHFLGFEYSTDTILAPVIILGIGSEYSILMTRALIAKNKLGKGKYFADKSFILISFIASALVLCILFMTRYMAINLFTFFCISALFVSMLVSLSVQPALFRFLTLTKSGKRKMSMTLTDFLFTVLAFSVFIGGCLMMNLLLPLIFILPVRKKAKKVIMHYMMMGFCRFEVYLMFNVRKKIINKGKENFKKPALIVANHQSHIDLLLLLMLHPKMIVITNQWVWNNPVYSAVIRYIDFYNISEGYENIMEKLKEKITEGYSILIFPEGSRSEDSRIMRFHKGAFVVAEQMNLEIVPIIIHGAGDCMNKGENYLRSGTVTMKIYERIKPDDTNYGSDYSERTKTVLKFFRVEYSNMLEEYATPKYYRNKLVKSYIYKGPVLEWYSRIKTSQEKNYELFDKLVPREASVVDMGCGYGFLSYMLGLASEKRKITGIDYDENKIAVANNSSLKNENINFIHSDILSYEISKSDAFILLDVLHYFSEEKQEQLLVNIINNLNENGLIIIRDAEQKLKKRHWGTMYTELFSSFTGFNVRNANEYFFTTTEKIKEIISRHGMKMEIIDESWFTSNLIYLIKK